MRLIVLALFVPALAIADPAPPKPPSTGKELAPHAPPALPAGAQAEIARTLIKHGDCNGHVATMSTALTIGAANLSLDERIAGNLELQRCAYAAKAWHAVLQSTAFLIDTAPDKSRPYDIIEALLALDDKPHAVKALDFLVEKFPKQRAELSVGISLIACHDHDYKVCFDASGKMLELLGKAGSPDAMLQHTIAHAFSAAALGKWPEFDAGMKAADKLAIAQHKNVDKLHAKASKFDAARTTKLFVDADVASQLPLGTYHYMVGNKIGDAGELVTLRFVNQSARNRDLKIAVEVPGVTERTTVTVSLPPGKEITKTLSPPLKIDFDVAKLRAPRQGQITVHLADGAWNDDQSYDVEILPHDYLPLARNVGSDSRRSTRSNALAWITPNAPPVDEFLTKAKARVDRRAFVGEQGPTLPQVKALFDELHDRGVSYVMDPDVFDEQVFSQRTRLPAEILASTNAQCLEGTLLYATLMEAIGLKPVLVFIPGHAFVAWHPSRYDGSKDLMFLETTLTGTATFDQAVEHATHHFADEVKLRHFDLGAAQLIDVAALRTHGYSPQPY